MSATSNTHRGIVQRIENGQAIVVMETAGCASCGQGGHCGVAQLAAGRPATVLKFPACAGLCAGDAVSVSVAPDQLGRSALLGYLFPAFAMLLGAAAGASMSGSDAATALGAMLGFVGALIVARIAVGLAPGLTPTPQLRPLTRSAQIS